MSKYIEMIRMRFLMMMAYRLEYYTGILIYTINIGAYYFLWNAIYGDKGSIEGMTSSQMTTYVAVAWMARAFYFNNIDREIAMDIRDGKVAIELLRPYHYLGMKAMAGLGEGIFRFFFFSLPGMILVTLIFPVDISIHLTTWGYFMISLVLSFTINTQINLLTGVMAFFFYNNMGLIRAKRVVVDLFSGLLLPISFFPLWIQDILKFLPFQGISYIPSMIFTNGFSQSVLMMSILQQVIWVIFLLIPIQLLWMAAKKQLIIQGG